MNRLLAVFSHPDDETFRPGGSLALLARSGVQVHLLTATRGEAGSYGDPPLCTPAELPGVRERELRCASAALGLQPPRLLGYEDGNLQEVEAEKMIAHILAAVDEIKPQVLLGFGPDGLSGHPDHIAIGRHTLAAFHRAEQVAALYTVAVPLALAQKLNMPQVHLVPDQAIALTVDVLPVWETKLAAMRCHATQWSSSPMAQASEERRRLFFGREYFVRAASRDVDADFMPAILQEHWL